MSAARLRGGPAANDAARVGQVVAAVQRADPALTADAVRAALWQVAPGPFGRAVIAVDLARSPSALTSGRPDARAGTQKLIKVLADAGSRTIRRPRCTICRRVRDLDLRLAGGGQACVACSRMLRAKTCPGCGRVRPVWRRLPDGSTRCQRCDGRDPSRWEVCAGCGQLRLVATRDVAGPVCQACLPRIKRPCSRCGSVAPMHSRRGGEAVCSTCAHRPQRVCPRCRYPRLHQTPDPGCPRCGTTAAVRCSTCGDDRFAFRVGARGCLRCRLHRRVDQLTEGADATRAAQLDPFLAGLRRADDPRAALDWIGKRRAARSLVIDMLHARAPVSHETLDQAGARTRPTSAGVEYLRQLLVDSEVLPVRHEPLSRAERAIARRLATCSGPTRAVLQRYATWHVLPKVRRRTRPQPPSQTSGSGAAAAALETFVTAHVFCTWLEAQGVDLPHLDQSLVDAWVAEHPHRADGLATFTTWAARQHLIPVVRVERRATSYPATFAPADAQLAAARACLTDDTIPARDRLAAALLLLYGQPLSRIAELRRDDLDLSDTADTGVGTNAGTGVAVRLGPTPLALPEPLAQLARQIAHEAPPTLGIARGFVDDSPWLFPGRPPSRPLNAHTLRRRLSRWFPVPHARAVRNTALVTLARDVPPVVLADLLGLSVGTAERWHQLAGGCWTGYAAARGGKPIVPNTPPA